MTRGTLIDTSVLIDALDASSPWNDWCVEAVVLAASRGPIGINQIILAELSVSFREPADVEAALDPDIERYDLPWAAAFLAGKAHQVYRSRGGTKRSPLPDFYIGAHAAVEGLDVLTRDPRMVLSYFRGVTVIAPSS